MVKRFLYNILLLVIFVSTLFAHEQGHTDSVIFTDRDSSVELECPDDGESFSFIIYGDRTGGPQSGLMILERAVVETNTIGPDLVMTVGDLVNGYNQRAEWFKQMTDFKEIMDKLTMPWFPVAGNHDVYWRGDDRPENEHDGDYEENFGPLWYAFEHKNCWFIVLYSDEGNPDTGEKNFKKPDCQVMSQRQIKFLERALEQAKDADHVFVFLHHPRWNGNENYGDDWSKVHNILKNAGNVSACFAGHTHRMKYDGTKDNIEYHTLATTGGQVPDDVMNPLQGKLHHYDIVTVHKDCFHVTAVPIGTVIDPKASRITQTLLTEKSWVIKKEQKRTLLFPIEIPEHNGTSSILRIGVAHAYDNTGDRGVTYELRSSEDDIIQQGYLSAEDYQWVKAPVSSGRHLIFMLKDEDTSLEGNHPGNGGKIMIELDVIK